MANARITWIGLDVGGANLKAATTTGAAACQAFPLWKHPDRLAGAVSTVLETLRAPENAPVALVMSGELADAFSCRAEGVRQIIAAVRKAAGTRPLRLLGIDGAWHAPGAAFDRPRNFAAANWLALATWAAIQFPKSELLIDVGTTTADIVRLSQGKPVPRAFEDAGRLATSELVYMGIVRTPVFALAPEAPYRGQSLPLVPEWFATTLDVHVVLGHLRPEDGDGHTADGRPADPTHCIRRLGRALLLTEPDAFTADDAERLARFLHDAQTERLARALRAVAADLNRPPATPIISGSGTFLADMALRRAYGKGIPTVRLDQRLSPKLSVAAPAYAAAMLARDALGPVTA